MPGAPDRAAARSTSLARAARRARARADRPAEGQGRLPRRPGRSGTARRQEQPRRPGRNRGAHGHGRLVGPVTSEGVRRLGRLGQPVPSSGAHGQARCQAARQHAARQRTPRPGRAATPDRTTRPRPAPGPEHAARPARTARRVGTAQPGRTRSEPRPAGDADEGLRCQQARRRSAQRCTPEQTGPHLGPRRWRLPVLAPHPGPPRWHRGPPRARPGPRSLPSAGDGPGWRWRRGWR